MRKVHRVGFEPTKHYAVDLDSTPFDRSGICAKVSMTGFEPAIFRLEVWCAIHCATRIYISARFRSLGQALFH